MWSILRGGDSKGRTDRCVGWLAAWGLALSAIGLQVQAAPVCPPASHDRPALDALKAAGFQLDDAQARQALALDLLPCLGAADPALRDGIGFEAYFTWMRAGQLDAATLKALRNALVASIEQPRAADDPGFAAPFAALVLAEVVRTDRMQAWLPPEERAALLALGVDYLEGVRDLRGFDEKAGWRHGIAHGADLVLQLAVHPLIDVASQRRLLQAVATQVQPAASATHAYVYGESERLARTVLVIAHRGELDAAALKEWLTAVAAPGALGSWGEAYKSQAGLARRHNVGNFLKSVYAGLPADAKYADLAAHVRGLIAGI